MTSHVYSPNKTPQDVIPNTSGCFFRGGRVKNTNRAKYNVFIHDQQLLFSKAEKRIEALLNGEKAKEQEKKYKVLVDRITEYEDQYVDDLEKAAFEGERIAINIRHLRRVQYLLHDIRNKSGSTKKSKKFAAVQARAEESTLWNADLGVPTAEPLQQQQDGGPPNEVPPQIQNDIDEEDMEWNALADDDFDRDELEHELTKAFDEIEKDFVHLLDRPPIVKPETVDLTAENVAASATMHAPDDSSYSIVPHGPKDRARGDEDVAFQPPILSEIEEILERLHIDPALAVESPIWELPTSPVDHKTFFVVKDVKSDGNCCWRSASLILTGSEEYYWQLREAVFKELRDYADIIEGIKSTEVQLQYATKCEELAKLKKGAVDKDFWAGTTELLGLASLLSINVIIYNPMGNNGQPFFTRCSPVGLRYTSGCPSIFLQSTPNHYQAIVGIRPLYTILSI